MAQTARTQLIGRVQGLEPLTGTCNGIRFIDENVTYYDMPKAKRNTAERVILAAYSDMKTYRQCNYRRGLTDAEIDAYLATLHMEPATTYTPTAGQYVFYGDITGIEGNNEA